MRLSKNKVKFLVSLQRKKYRQKYGNFVVEGDKMVRELLRQDTLSVIMLVALPGWPHLHLSLQKGIETIICDPEELKQISSLTTPNQVLAVVEMPNLRPDWQLPFRELILYLDAIRDPGNMGTILRIADWFGMPEVWCSNDCADVFQPKVIQASMGAFLRVKTAEVDLSSFQQGYPEAVILGTTLKGTSVFQADLPAGALLVIGNESIGIRPDYLTMLHGELTIPASSNAGAESLNVAVATGIFVAAWRYGRHTTNQDPS